MRLIIIFMVLVHVNILDTHFSCAEVASFVANSGNVNEDTCFSTRARQKIKLHSFEQKY